MINTDWQWQDLDSLSREQRCKILPAIKQLVYNHSEAVMDHDLDWLYARCGDNKHAQVFVCQDEDGSLLGYAPFFVHPSDLSFELFGRSLFSYPIRRYCMTAGPLLAVDNVPQTAVQNLLTKLNDLLGERDVLFGLGIASGSIFEQAFHQNDVIRKTYQIFPSGKVYRRRLILLPACFDNYLKLLSHSTRKNVRRVLRNFENENNLEPQYRIFVTPDEVAEFIALAHSVSEKTYQKKMLDIGINDNEETRQQLIIAAENGWLRSYIIFCKGKPIAFQHGYLYNGVYYAEQTGYDPEWSGKSIGTIMQIYRIRDLIDRGAEKLDFLYGDSEKKRTLSNAFHEEQNFYLIPYKFPLSLIAYGLRLFNSATELLGDFMEKYGLKSAIRRFLRKHSTAHANK